MPTQGNTYGLATAIKGYMQSTQANGGNAYANVIIGGLKDYTDALPVGVVFPLGGTAKRYTLGRSAKIHDELRFNVASVVSYVTASTAEQQICNIRDAVTFQFMQTATLNTAGPIIINIVPNSERWSFFKMNGSPMRSHEFQLLVTYEYTLPNGPQP